MRWIRNIGIGLVLMVAVNACFTPPNYPIAPQIEFVNNELKFVKNTAPQGLDTLRIVLKFTDGDGDVGTIKTNSTALEDQSEFFYFVNSTGDTRLTTNSQSNLTYSFKTLNPNFILNGTQRPAGPLPPLDCNSWTRKLASDNKTPVNPAEYVYYELNPNYYNIYVDYFIKNNDGTFARFDVREEFNSFPSCTADLSLNGSIIPNLSKEIGKNSPLDGKIKFNIVSLGIDFIFTIKTLKVKVYIVDRAGNKSNEVESKEFTLQSIR